MTEREKLMKLLSKSPLGNYPLGEQFSNGTVEKIADYLLKNGVIAPPVKVGDTVYMIYLDDGIEPMIESLEVLEVSTHRIWMDSTCFDYDDIGKTVFLTREEAEKALAERSG